MITTTFPTSAKARFEALDGLRGVAALLIVFSHVEWTNHLTGRAFVRNGYLAVDLFFVLSGLVIATNYATRLVDFNSFLCFIKLRFFRLYPLHLTMLGAFVGLEYLKLIGGRAFGLIPAHQPFTGGESYRMLMANLLLIQGLGWARVPNWNFPSWSISCECFVYVLFGISVMMGLLRRRLLVICISLTAILLYCAMAFGRGTLDLRFDLGMGRCIAGFILGLSIWRFSDTLQKRSARTLAVYQAVTALAVILAMTILSGPVIVIVIPLFVLLIALLQSDTGPVASLLLWKPVQFLGRISYSIYMVHMFVIVCCLMGLKRIMPISFDPDIGRVVVAVNPWLGDLLVFAVVTAVLMLGSITYRLVEEPGRMLGRKRVLNPALNAQPRPRIQVMEPSA